jgi:DNA-binding GntR family transcriptional regulator
LLRAEIISGKLAPGEPLAEIALADRFQTSRAPVREALIELEREGLIQFGATGRTRVRTLTPKDFDEIMETRVALESMGARRAAAHWTDEDTAWVEANLAAQAQASTLTELSGLDVEMHCYILQRGGNGRLLGLWQSVRWQFEMGLASSHRLQQKLSFDARGLTVESHRRLLAAIASRKPEAAARAMATHIEEWTEWWAVEFPGAETKPAAAKPA